MMGPATPQQRRGRRVLSCTLCKKRKIRCNRELPCSNCIKTKNNSTCVFENGPSSSTKHRDAFRFSNQHSLIAPKEIKEYSRSTSPVQESSDLVTTLPPSLVADSLAHVSSPLIRIRTSCEDSEFLEERIQELQELLSKARASSHATSLASDALTVRGAGIETVERTVPASRAPTTPGSEEKNVRVVRAILHKGRMFGQSHWMNGVVMFQEVLQMIEPLLQDKTLRISAQQHRCKTMSRLVKASRTPAWPQAPTLDLPPKHVADELVKCYLRTSETIHRVLFLPSFEKEYEAVWTTKPEPPISFIVQLKLILALGAVAYDERFSLRPSASRWVIEGQTYLSNPSIKSKLNLQTLQNHILLILARERLAIGTGQLYITVGSLVRIAIHMGVHRDPGSLPSKPILFCEMRRRLWNTIIELCLHTSMHAAAPPLISLDDFDTEAPGNYDDDQLQSNEPTARPDTHLTNMSVAIALRKILPIRLQILRFLNNLKSRISYHETLRLDSEFRSLYKDLRRSLHSAKGAVANDGKSFALLSFDSLMFRYLSALHVPYYGPSFQDTAYEYSRSTIVDMVMKSCYLSYQTPIATGSLVIGEPLSAGLADFRRMAMCGHGFFHIVVAQAVYILCLEVKSQVEEQDELGPVHVRQDMLALIEGGKIWHIESLEAGEANMKGYLFLEVMMAYIDGTRRGLDETARLPLMVEAAEAAQSKSLKIFDAAAAALGVEVVECGKFDINTPSYSQTLGGWDYLTMDGPWDYAQFDDGEWMNDMNISML